METVFLLYIRVLRQEYRTLLMLCTGLTERAHELSLIWDGCDKLLRDYFSWQYRLQNVEFVSLLPRSGQAFHPKRMNKVSGRSCSGGQDPVSWDGHVAIGSGAGTIVELVLTGDLRMLRRCHVRHEPVFACLTSRPRFVSPSHPFSSGLNRGKNVRFPD